LIALDYSSSRKQKMLQRLPAVKSWREEQRREGGKPLPWYRLKDCSKRPMSDTILTTRKR